ncbi:MAG: APC family permease [Clostridia bacterium]|nr:APC family permease [Clostridia bacterium]
MENTENKKGVSAIDFFCIGFGSIVGVGWAVSINNWMANCGGPVPAALGYIISLVMMIPIALCYCELVPMYPVAGGEMAFAYKAFGERLSMVSGWAAFGAFVAIVPWEAIQITDVLGYLIPGLKAGGPLYEIAGSGIHLSSIIIGIICSIILFLINNRGLASAAKLQRFLCIFLVSAAVLGALIAVIFGDLSNLKPVYDNTIKEGLTHSSMFGGVLAMLVSVPFFVTGFETIPQGIESAGGSVKAVGKTVVFSVVAACVFYAMLLICFGSGIGWRDFVNLDNPAASNMFLALLPGTPGRILFWLITLGAIAGLLTTWNGFFMASANLLMAMARGRLMPAAFAKQNANGAPVNGLRFALVLSIAGPLAGAGLIGDLTSFSSCAILLSWMITAYSLIRLRKTAPETDRPYRIPGGVKTGWFAAVLTMIIIVLLFVPGNPLFMGKMAIVMFIGWMLLGFALYMACSGQRRAMSPLEREKTIFAKLDR